MQSQICHANTCLLLKLLNSWWNLKPEVVWQEIELACLHNAIKEGVHTMRVGDRPTLQVNSTYFLWRYLPFNKHNSTIKPLLPIHDVPCPKHPTQHSKYAYFIVCLQTWNCRMRLRHSS
jgi:hypothetical protein